MAQEGIGGPQANKLHPFFVKGPPTKLPDPTTTTAVPVASITEQTPPSETLNPPSNQTDGTKKRRKNEDSIGQDGPGPKKQRRQKGEVGDLTQTYVGKLDQDAVIPMDVPAENVVYDFPTPPLSDISTIPSNQTLPTTSNMENTDIPTTTEEAPLQTPPKAKKVLKFNPRTGTLGSPPKPKLKTTPSRIVSIKYGQDEASRKDIGNRISQILEGTLKVPSTPKKTRPTRTSKKNKAAAPNQESISKSTHPFFKGKPTKKPAVSKDTSAVHQKSPPARQSVFMSTPMSPKKNRVPFATDKMPQFGMKSVAKVPGAMHPLWPAQDMSHIRGFEAPSQSLHTSPLGDQSSKKSKGSVVTITTQESVIGRLCESLNLDLVRDTLPRDPDAFEPAPMELRIPARHFESGPKLQRRIRSQLQSHPSPNGIDQLQDDVLDQRDRKAHPAISRFYHALETTLSAYDRSSCENQIWTHKYAPISASQILQAGREGLLLKEWLQSLNIQSVETGGVDVGGKGKGKSEAPRKRRKKNKLDGFIVDSDEEANGMSEISEDEDNWAPSGIGLLKKTVIRSGDTTAKGSKDKGRLTNAVVISGPHGSGKTAAVYAVAKELGFEVFEINSGSKRSGKDILEKVGDMTRNHLVQHHGTEQPIDEDVDDEVSRDLKSGKQGTMTAFFKPKPPAIVKQPESPKQPAEEKQVEPRKSNATKSQKQSLILLEEVDVLYEEDKQFWATLMGLIAQSKRPFIMTCNDENLVPLQTLNLHGIFRFTPPPINLAVDLCLLIAANEGHALRRSAVEALYKSRGNDLRATLTELNYWCQIGVGDRRGGSDWFYLRWPKGSDVDENGHVVRVVSEDTYLDGLGWMSRDLIASCPDAPELKEASSFSGQDICQSALAAEEEAMRQAWDSWNLDMGDWHSSLDLDAWAHTVSHPTTRAQLLYSLTAYDDFCGSLSDADLCSSGAFGTKLQESIDSTLPELPTKAKDDFIVGRRLLEANPKVLQTSPQYAISIALKSAAREELARFTPSLDLTPVHDIVRPVTEDKAVSILSDSFRSPPRQMTRLDIALAFDPIAVSEKAQLSSYLDPSVFDRNLKLIVLDVAPWVRGIVEYDHRLMQGRLKLSNLLSEGGKRKRMRNTRSAYSALEGGERRTTRRERYFGDCINTEFVRRTRGEKWLDALQEMERKVESERDDLVSVPSSSPSEASSTMHEPTV